MSIYFTSDQHFNHDKDFIWEQRGFKNVTEMNEALIGKWNEVITPWDTVFHLGDLCLGKIEDIEPILRRLNGEIHLVIGNHDTVNRIAFYKTVPQIKRIIDFTTVNHNGCHLALSHYPKDITKRKRHYSQEMYCVHGHIHTRDRFMSEYKFTYNVAVDAHELKPILIDDLVTDIRNHYIM